ncbi:12737_t:CDS:2, partial [Racocetra persica]
SSLISKIEIQKSNNKPKQSSEIRYIQYGMGIVSDELKIFEYWMIQELNKLINDKSIVYINSLEINPKSSSSSKEAVNKEINSDNIKMAVLTVVCRDITNIYQKTNNFKSQDEPLYSSENTIKHNEPVEIESHHMKDRRQRTMTVIERDLRVGAMNRKGCAECNKNSERSKNDYLKGIKQENIDDISNSVYVKTKIRLRSNLQTVNPV